MRRRSGDEIASREAIRLFGLTLLTVLVMTAVVLAALWPKIERMKHQREVAARQQQIRN